MRSWNNYNPKNLAVSAAFAAAAGAVILVKYRRDTLRAVEHGQRCERLRFAVKQPPEACVERLAQAGDIGLLRSELARGDGELTLHFYPLTVRGWRMPLRRYAYAVRFEPGAMILERRPDSKHALGQKVLRRYLEQAMGR